jgi:U32 family peptidase
MELLSPAGNVEKLFYAYTYGADAAYIGLKNFSLRIKADNFKEDEYTRVIELKKKFPGKKLYCALNILFHNNDIDLFFSDIEYFKKYPIDSFIVQDLGIVPILQKYFPDAALHLSTQASCINREAVKMYRSLGFKRIVLGREVSLKEIREIKDAVPDMELEAFCHGAMCIAYAGRCLMSAYLTGRSAQSGFCSHTCRWDYDVLAENTKQLAESGLLSLREHSRSEEYFPVYEGDNFTAVLSSKDLCMINNLADMKAAGIDSFKIEGRMKSIYYVALVTQAYRKALDVLEGKLTADQASPFIAELENVAHRKSTTGFYYNRADADKTTTGASDSRYLLAGTIDAELSGNELQAVINKGERTLRERENVFASLSPEAHAARERCLMMHPEKTPEKVIFLPEWKMYRFTPLNKIATLQELEFIVPDRGKMSAASGSWELIDPEDGTERSWTCNGHLCVLYTKYVLAEGSLIRIVDPEYVAGRIRDTGR